MSPSWPKSVIHYWLQLSHEPNQDFICLLDHLSERDLGLLEIALSERDIRQLYMRPLERYYETHQIVIAKVKSSKSHLEWILKRGLNDHIKKLVISNNESDEDIDFDAYDLKFSNLLEAKCWSISLQICRMLGSHSPNLQSLRILGDADYLSRESLESICSGCRKLKFIEISEHPEGDRIYPTSAALSIISKYCKDLEILQLNRWDRVESDDIGCLSELTNLLCLDIEYVYDWFIFPSAVFASNTKLENVSLCGDLPHDPIMRALGAHCHSSMFT